MIDACAWHRHPWPLPPLSGDARTTVCVVGLGGTGLAAVHALRDHGVAVLGLDAAPFPGAGAAGRNGGFLLAGLASFHHTARHRYGAAAATLYALTQDALSHLFSDSRHAATRCGSVRWAATAAERRDLAAHAEALRADGFPCALSADGEWLTLHEDGVFDPFRRATRLARAAADRGARLVGGARVRSVEPGAVWTDRGVVRADVVLVCVDGGLERVLPALAPTVRTLRLQMLATAPLRDRVASQAVYARDGLDYWQQRPDGRLFLGGARDVDPTPGGPSIPTLPVQRALDARCAAIAPGARVTHRWAGAVGYTADGLPVVSEVEPEVWAAGGYCGTGNVVGWLAGRSLASAARGRPDPFRTALAVARAYSAESAVSASVSGASGSMSSAST